MKIDWTFIARWWSRTRRDYRLRKKYTREPVSFSPHAFVSIMKHYLIYGVLAVVIGVCVGVVTAIFGHGLLFLNEFRDAHLYYLVPFLGVAGLLIMSVNMRYGGRAQKGMGLIFAVGLGEEDSIPLRMVPLTIFSTWMTHLFGGSAGREGVAVQIGATVANQFSRFRPKGADNHIVMACGMAAGFAGLFGTPLAATFFCLEVLVVGSLYYEALAPALVAAYFASFTARSLGLEAMLMPIGAVPEMDSTFMGLTLVAGVVFGAVGWTFSWLLNHLKLYFAILIDDPRWRIFIIGSILAFVFILLGQGRYSGLGDALFAGAFTGGDIYYWDWLLKLLLTVLTLACGFQGGELTPLFVIGATLGAVLATALGLPVALFAAMGCVAVFGAATKTLLTPIFIGAEVFGTQGLAFYALAVMVAFIISGHYGIYTKQKHMDGDLLRPVEDKK